MSARVGKALIDDGSPVAAACAPMKASFELLFNRARDAGVIRAGVTPVQVLALVAALPKDPRSDSTIEPYLDIVLSGLRAGGPLTARMTNPAGEGRPARHTGTNATTPRGYRTADMERDRLAAARAARRGSGRDPHDRGDSPS
jgi:hypothetical protein